MTPMMARQAPPAGALPNHAAARAVLTAGQTARQGRPVAWDNRRQSDPARRPGPAAPARSAPSHPAPAARTPRETR